VVKWRNTSHALVRERVVSPREKRLSEPENEPVLDLTSPQAICAQL
jgi:hypothetical protein